MPGKRPSTSKRAVYKWINPDMDPLAMLALSETIWQRYCFEPFFARLGWEGFHVYDSRETKGKGFLDWTLWRERLIFVELKDEKGMPTEEQTRLLLRLQAMGHEAYLWRPSDWPRITEILTRRT